MAQRKNVILAPSERSSAFIELVAKRLAFRPGVLPRLNANGPLFLAANLTELNNAIGLIDSINAHERDPAVYLEGMHAAVRAVESRLLNPRPLYTHKFRLEQLGDALNMSAERPEGFGAAPGNRTFVGNTDDKALLVLEQLGFGGGNRERLAVGARGAQVTIGMLFEIAKRLPWEAWVGMVLGTAMIMGALHLWKRHRATRKAT